jgi:hypothetical protein
MNQQARSDLCEKVDNLLRVRSSITDDEFGHWVQALDGRRVAVVLDACMSGGFAGEQGDAPGQDAAEDPVGKILDRARALDAPPLRFDFLQAQLGRLKDLGQGNTAMLAASHASESSQQTPLFPEQEPAYAWRADLIKESFHHDQPAADDAMGVFTFYLVNTLLQESGPVDVRAAGESCQRQLSEHYRWLSAKTKRPQKGKSPVYYDHSRPSILVKP